jgi:hypothetical protein
MLVGEGDGHGGDRDRDNLGQHTALESIILLEMVVLGGNWYPSRFKLLYT